MESNFICRGKDRNSECSCKSWSTEQLTSTPIKTNELWNRNKQETCPIVRKWRAESILPYSAHEALLLKTIVFTIQIMELLRLQESLWLHSCTDRANWNSQWWGWKQKSILLAFSFSKMLLMLIKKFLAFFWCLGFLLEVSHLRVILTDNPVKLWIRHLQATFFCFHSSAAEY